MPTSEPEHSRLQGLFRRYTTLDIEQEWSLLGQHESSEQAPAAVRAIRDDILGFPPNTPTVKAVYSSELSQVSSLFAAMMFSSSM